MLRDDRAFILCEEELMNHWQSGDLGKWPSAVTIFTDGASRGNPGPSAFGLSVRCEEEQIVFEYAEKIPETTNNVAEYKGVQKALELAVRQKVRSLLLKSDSQLLIRQLLGQYKVKSEHLRPFFKNCKQLSEQIPKVIFSHVPREENKRADELANDILDGGFF